MRQRLLTAAQWPCILRNTRTERPDQLGEIGLDQRLVDEADRVSDIGDRP